MRLTTHLRAGVVALFAVAFGATAAHAVGGGDDEKSLSLYNLHTKERATIVFKRNGKYDQAGLNQLNRFLRDWRKNEPTKMDPALFDLLYEVYKQGGSNQPINVVCGYRSPGTNAMLRRRSSGVAQNSQHTRGKAMDFYIPGVPLAKLRAIGLRMQVGGVGFYPTSGSPFVHLDTGSVRHWPKMTRQQLLAVFPNGGTLHVPSDGKPLPGYAQALAAYKARKAIGAPVAVASNSEPDEDEDEAPAPAAKVASAPVSAPDAMNAGDIPLPRSAPDRSPSVVAFADLPATPLPVARPGGPTLTIDRMISADPIGNLVSRSTAGIDFNAVFAENEDEEHGVDFAAVHNAPAPVPAALAQAMAQRDRTSRPSTASLPIAPTAVVATIDVSRPLRASAMTTAVLRGRSDTFDNIPTVMGFAPPPEVAAKRPAVASAFGVPVPQSNPLRAAAQPAPLPEPQADTASRTTLTFTALDTQGLRIWIASQSTREKRYALLTMPDVSRQPELLAEPDIAVATTFSGTTTPGLRTDHFASQAPERPSMFDIAGAPQLTLR